MEVSEEDLKNMSPEELLDFQKKNCVFCQISNGRIPAKKVYEDDTSIAVLDINPANLGHVLLLPKEHYAVLPQVPDDIIAHLFMTAKGLSEAVLKAFKVRGTNVFVANGVAAGQKAPHVLIHIIPRSLEDGLKLNIPKKKGLVAAQKKLQKALQPHIVKAFGVEEKPGKKKETKKEKAPEKKEVKKEKVPKKAAKKKATKKAEEKKEETPKENVSLDDIAGLFK